jgi:hypothetical protein
MHTKQKMVGLRCFCDCDFITKSAILNKISETELFKNCVFKKLRFENAKNYFFKSQTRGAFLKTQNFKS